MTKTPKPNPFDKLKNVARPGLDSNNRLAAPTASSSTSSTSPVEDSRVEQLGSGMSSRKLPGALLIPLDLITTNPNQIRSEYDQETLQELATDIKTRGILEPILVREISPGQYQIIAGERRYRAAKLAGLTDIPALVRNMDDKDTSLAMLVENIQRQELSPLDEKRFFEQLQAEYNLSAQEIARLINKSAMYVSRRLRGELPSLQVSSSSDESEIPHNDNGTLQSLDNSQSDRRNSPKSSKGSQPGAAKNTVFKFSLAPIEKLTGNLATAKQFFQQADARPNPEKTRQIKQSLEELKKQIAELEATLSDDKKT